MANNVKTLNELLEEIDEQTIRRYAKLNGIPGSDHEAKADLIIRIANKSNFKALMAPATRLEINSFDLDLEQKLRDHIEKKFNDHIEKKFNVLDAKDQIVDTKIKLIDEKVKASDEPAKRLDAKIKGMQYVMVFISIAGFSWGGFTAFEFIDINKQRALAKTAIETSILSFATTRQILIETNLDELSDYMNKVIANKSDNAMLLRVDRRLVLLERASELALSSEDDDPAASASKDDAKLLEILTKAYKGLRALRNTKTSSNFSNEHSANDLLNRAEDKWKDVIISLNSKEGRLAGKRYPKHIQKLNTYSQNTLGFIKLRKFLYGGGRSQHLELAEKRFKSAITSDGSFYPAYHNLALVYYEKYKELNENYKGLKKAEEKSELLEELRRILKSAHSSELNALEYSDDNTARYTLYNNRAYYLLLEAELNKLSNSPLEAQQNINESIESIENALNIGVPKGGPKSGLVYLTKAEIYCFNNSLNSDNGNKHPQITSGEFTKLLETARQTGFEWRIDVDIEVFLKTDGRFLNHCQNLFDKEIFNGLIRKNIYRKK